MSYGERVKYQEKQKGELQKGGRGTGRGQRKDSDKKSREVKKK